MVVIKKLDYVLLDKKSVFIDSRAKIGKNVIIYENNRIEGDCVIEDNVTLFPGCFIINSIIGKGTKVYTSIIEKSKIGKCSAIGPYCYLKKSSLGEQVKVGAFVEIKNSEILENKIIFAGSVIFENELKNGKC